MKKKKEEKDLNMYKGALSEASLWKSCLTTGITMPEWKKRHFTKPKDKKQVRRLIEAYEQVELYCQNKVNELEK